MRQLSAKLPPTLDFKVEVAFVLDVEKDRYFEVPFVLDNDLLVYLCGVTDLLLLLLWAMSVSTHFGT